MKKNNPIGVFDSGIGGLTVLEELVQMFPNEDFIYVADTLNCPYGTKSKEEIADKVTDIAKYLLSRNVKAIVIACNTATANSKHLKDITNIPILGVIEPTANYVKKITKNGNIAILATNMTIDTGAYQNLLDGFNVYPKKCSDFVEIVEKMEMNTKKSYSIVKDKLQDLEDKEIDTVILGCTHFPLLKNEVGSVLKEANLISSGRPTGEALNGLLVNNNLINDRIDSGTIEINTTGDKEYVKMQTKWLKLNHLPIKEIKVR